MTFPILTLELDLLLQEDIEGGGCLQGVSEILGDDHVHHVNQLDIDTVLVEALVQIIH